MRSRITSDQSPQHHCYKRIHDLGTVEFHRFFWTLPSDITHQLAQKALPVISTSLPFLKPSIIGQRKWNANLNHSTFKLICMRIHGLMGNSFADMYDSLIVFSSY